MNPQGNQTYAPDHREEAHKLEADGYLQLIAIHMAPPNEPAVSLFLHEKNTVIWQGHTWESYPVNLTDYQRNTNGEMSRPKLSLGNPDGLLSRYVHQRWVDNAIVERFRVLGAHAQANINSYLKNTWRVGRVMSLTRTVAVLELREALDGPSYVLPGRAFYPPEFPTVSL